MHAFSLVCLCEARLLLIVGERRFPKHVARVKQNSPGNCIVHDHKSGIYGARTNASGPPRSFRFASIDRCQAQFTRRYSHASPPILLSFRSQLFVPARAETLLKGIASKERAPTSQFSLHPLYRVWRGLICKWRYLCFGLQWKMEWNLLFECSTASTNCYFVLLSLSLSPSFFLWS